MRVTETRWHQPKSRPNSPAAVYRLDGAKALLAKALLFVKQAEENVDEVRRVPNVALVIVVDELRHQMRLLSDAAQGQNGLSLKTETPEEET